MRTLSGSHLKTAAIRGLKTAWLDSGEGPKELILFIHGYLDTPAAWDAQVKHFAGDYRLILPYGRGVGDSAPPPRLTRYGAYSILLDHLEILRLSDPAGNTPIHIVGHDVGGVHAWMLACHKDARVKSVTILNSAHPKQYLRRILWPRQVLKSWYLGAFQVPYFSEAMLWIFHKQILKVLSTEGWLPPHGELSLKDFEGSAINAVNQYRQFARDIPHFLRERTAPTEVPVLVISSEDDRYLETPSALEFSDIAKNVTIRVVKGKHWLQSEQPERINRILGEFWSAHP